jgi:hypothetical protein
MNVEQIERLKREYTDKYVAVEPSRPELARFKNVVGQVKTVNMSGRALVEFADYHLNIGWYDIDIDSLKVVERPQPKATEAAKKPAKSAAKPPAAPAATAEKKLSPLEMARAMDAGKKAGGAPAKAPAPAGEKMSTSDILAAARAKTASQAEAAAPAPPKPKPAAEPKKMSTADILAAARGKAASAAKPQATAPTKPTPAKPTPATPTPQQAQAAPAPSKLPEKAPVDRSKLSTADILSMARGEKKAAVAKSSAPTPAPTADTSREPEVTVRAANVESPEESSAEAAPSVAQAPSERVDRSKMTVDEMIAWCRAHDG